MISTHLPLGASQSSSTRAAPTNHVRFTFRNQRVLEQPRPVSRRSVKIYSEKDDVNRTSTDDIKAQGAELLDQISTIQAGFPVYKQTVEQYISTLACFQEEIDDLKKANTEKDATIREFEEAKLQMTVDLQDLDKRVSGMLGKYNGVGVTVVSGADQAKAKEARAEMTDEETQKVDMELFEAIEKGDTALLKALIEEGADLEGMIEMKIRYAWTRVTPLIAAAGLGNLEIAQLLIDQGANVNAKDNSGTTALEYAVWLEDLGMIKLLIENNADMNVADDDYNMPLLTYGMRTDNVGKIQYLVQHGAKVNAGGGTDDTPLRAAAVQGHLKIVEFLIQNKAQVNALGASGSTALMAAAHNGHLSIVEFLIKNNADLNHEDGGGATALDRAKYQHPEVAAVLKAAGGKEGSNSNSN